MTELIEKTRKKVKLILFQITSINKKQANTFSSGDLLGMVIRRSIDQLSAFTENIVDLKVNLSLTDIGKYKDSRRQIKLRNNWTKNGLIYRNRIRTSCLPLYSVMKPCHCRNYPILNFAYILSESTENTIDWLIQKDRNRLPVARNEAKSERKKQKEKPIFSCEFCKKIFTTKSSLKEHGRIHSGIFKFVNFLIYSF